MATGGAGFMHEGEWYVQSTQIGIIDSRIAHAYEVITYAGELFNYKDRN